MVWVPQGCAGRLVRGQRRRSSAALANSAMRARKSVPMAASKRCGSGEPSTSRPKAGLALATAPSRSGNRASDAAGWGGGGGGAVAEGGGDGGRLQAIQAIQSFQAPQAQRGLWYVEQGAQTIDDGLRKPAPALDLQQRRAPLVQFVRDGRVVGAVAHHLHDALLQALDLLAQHLGLALLQAHGARAMRVGDLHAGQHLGMALEEARRAEQKLGDIVFGDRGNDRREGRSGHGQEGSSIWPSNTVVAGPVMTTESVAAPPQATLTSPPRMATCTSESSSPRRMPADTAAQAPEPQARVSPAPRSNTRSRTWPRSTTCMKPAFMRCAKRAWLAISGPISGTGARSTSSPNCTACGLPMETMTSQTVAVVPCAGVSGVASSVICRSALAIEAQPTTSDR